MALEPLGREIARGVFYERLYERAPIRVDRFVVRPGATVPFHTNAEGVGYMLVACAKLAFLSLTEDGRINEFRRMEPGEVLTREAGFGHVLVNMSEQDFVCLKVWSSQPEGSLRGVQTAEVAPPASARKSRKRR